MIDRIHKLIRRSNHPSTSLIELLKATLIGTEGSLYQLLDTEQKIHQLHDATHLSLVRNNKVIGNITICKRKTQFRQQEITTHYLRYFAFDPSFQGKNGQSKGNTTLHQYFKALFETSNFNPVNPKRDKSLYWAFIDPQNSRSFNLNQKTGFQTIGKFKTFAFSRVNPKNTRVKRIGAGEKEGLPPRQRRYEDT